MAKSRIDKKNRLIIKLNQDEARAFFLKEESYCNLELPSYIGFQLLLNDINSVLANTPLPSCYNGKKGPRLYEGLNYVLLNNKDGKYAWRPITLIHPAIYVALVHCITAENAWNHIVSKFQEFSNCDNIRCFSVPLKSCNKKSDKSEQILSWWSQIEQQSIELSIEYQYLFQTDITDCYGSIYTHSIVWALHTKPVAQKNPKDKNLIGNVIDWHLQDMLLGQTNGIPQGSVLMDFIAEIVLGYTDLKLSERLEALGVGKYRILRYRDDYRIFVNNPLDGEKILIVLTEILSDTGMKLSPLKTSSSSNVIREAIKKDKLAWLYRKQSNKSLQKHLLIIHDHAFQFLNSGSVLNALSKFNKRLNGHLSHEEVMPLISLSVDIACKSPKTYPVVMGIISRLISLLDDERKLDLFKKIVARFSNLPNTGHMEIWLQRVSITFAKDIEYNESLCKLVANDKVKIWNSDWISSKELKGLLDPKKIIDIKTIENLPAVIPQNEIDLFFLHTDGAY